MSERDEEDDLNLSYRQGYEKGYAHGRNEAAPAPGAAEAIEALVRDGAYLSIQFREGEKPWEVQLHQSWGFQVKYGETLRAALAALREAK